jgi:hypothetical protein
MMGGRGLIGVHPVVVQRRNDERKAVFAGEAMQKL